LRSYQHANRDIEEILISWTYPKYFLWAGTYSEITIFDRQAYGFFMPTAGNEQGRVVSSFMAGVGVNEPGLASTTESGAVSTNCATLANLIKSRS
jgi:hypothetical protein